MRSIICLYLLASTSAWAGHSDNDNARAEAKPEKIVYGIFALDCLGSGGNPSQDGKDVCKCRDGKSVVPPKQCANTVDLVDDCVGLGGRPMIGADGFFACECADKSLRLVKPASTPTPTPFASKSPVVKTKEELAQEEQTAQSFRIPRMLELPQIAKHFEKPEREQSPPAPPPVMPPSQRRPEKKKSFGGDFDRQQEPPPIPMQLPPIQWDRIPLEKKAPEPEKKSDELNRKRCELPNNRSWGCCLTLEKNKTEGCSLDHWKSCDQSSTGVFIPGPTSCADPKCQAKPVRRKGWHYYGPKPKDWYESDK